jgi:uncharacterized protein (UPF0335 family)
MSNTDAVTKADILYLKEQLNRIESEVEQIKKMVKQVLAEMPS